MVTDFNDIDSIQKVEMADSTDSFSSDSSENDTRVAPYYPELCQDWCYFSFNKAYYARKLDYSKLKSYLPKKFEDIGPAKVDLFRARIKLITGKFLMRLPCTFNLNAARDFVA